jgi:hypothetical protein
LKIPKFIVSCSYFVTYKSIKYVHSCLKILERQRFPRETLIPTVTSKSTQSTQKYKFLPTPGLQFPHGEFFPTLSKQWINIQPMHTFGGCLHAHRGPPEKANRWLQKGNKSEKFKIWVFAILVFLCNRRIPRCTKLILFYFSDLFPFYS